jgi:hypothetical protein
MGQTSVCACVYQRETERYRERESKTERERGMQRLREIARPTSLLSWLRR